MSIAVVMRMPTPREAAKGTRNCAWMARSSVRGGETEEGGHRGQEDGTEAPLGTLDDRLPRCRPFLTAVDQ